MRTESGTPDARPATSQGTMRAIVQDAYGETDVLRLAEINRPAIGDDEVLVRVAAAGVDQGAWLLMAGLPYRSGSPGTASGRRGRRRGDASSPAAWRRSAGP